MSTVEEARAALRARMGGKIQNRHGLSRAQAVLVKEAPSGPDNTEKVRSTLQRMQGSNLPGTEVIFFKKNGEKVMHFTHPRVTIAPSVSACCVAGEWTEKAEDEFNSDKQMMDILQKLSMNMKAPEGAAAAEPQEPAEVPELVVEDFEAEAKVEALD